MKSTLRITFFFAALLTVAALAHGGVEHLKGTITKVDGGFITLQGEKGTPIQVETDAKTEFSRGTATATLKDVAVGDKAVIHAVEHDERLTARVVKLGAASPSKASLPDAGIEPHHH